MSPDSLQQILTVLAPLAVTVGVIIVLLQLRNQQRLRQIDTVMRLYSSFGQEAFLRRFERVTSWSFDTYETYRENSTPDDQISLMVVGVFFENMGLLLKRRLAPLDLLDDLLSGPILLAWPKARPVWVGLRAEYNQPSWAEWFEFFYDAMVKRMAKLNKKQGPRAEGRAQEPAGADAASAREE